MFGGSFDRNEICNFCFICYGLGVELLQYSKSAISKVGILTVSLFISCLRSGKSSS
jgi:hypothetical protein